MIAGGTLTPLGWHFRFGWKFIKKMIDLGYPNPRRQKIYIFPAIQMVVVLSCPKKSNRYLRILSIIWFQTTDLPWWRFLGATGLSDFSTVGYSSTEIFGPNFAHYTPVNNLRNNDQKWQKFINAEKSWVAELYV